MQQRRTLAASSSVTPETSIRSRVSSEQQQKARRNQNGDRLPHRRRGFSWRRLKNRIHQLRATEDGIFLLFMGAAVCLLLLLIALAFVEIVKNLTDITHNRRLMHLEQEQPNDEGGGFTGARLHEKLKRLSNPLQHEHKRRQLTPHHQKEGRHKEIWPNVGNNSEGDEDNSWSQEEDFFEEYAEEDEEGEEEDSFEEYAGGEQEETEEDSEEEEDSAQLPLPFNSIYKIPEAWENVGDRSDAYARLRKHYDTELLPLDLERSQHFVQTTLGFKPPKLRFETSADDTMRPLYDIYNCPYNPPESYPQQWNLVHQLLHDWPVDQTDVPSHGIFQGLCVFDYNRTKDFEKAWNYRFHELPFVVTNDPHVARTVERWHQPGYVEQMVGPNVPHRTEYNTNAHFMYERPLEDEDEDEGDETIRHRNHHLRDAKGRRARVQRHGSVPEQIRMAFGDWLEHANGSHVGVGDEYWYHRLIGCGLTGNRGDCDAGSTEALFDEMPFFQPKPSLYIVEPSEQMGIHCRFGMKGVIAENHFDAPRNAIALLKGQRRYILASPNQCDKLTLLPSEHPSARHSAVDYSDPNLETYPEFEGALSNEVVLQAGQVLYLPSNWFHFIVSLDLNFQCNTRSGESNKYDEDILKCGF